ASDAFPTPAKRPNFSLLDKTKIKDTYSVQVPNWRTSLEEMIAKI
ncbi:MULTISPECIES: sugar nucleotide-binding protein, partial [unclassified Flavobacterium]